MNWAQSQVRQKKNECRLHLARKVHANSIDTSLIKSPLLVEGFMLVKHTVIRFMSDRICAPDFTRKPGGLLVALTEIPTLDNPVYTILCSFITDTCFAWRQAAEKVKASTNVPWEYWQRMKAVSNCRLYPRHSTGRDNSLAGRRPSTPTVPLIVQRPVPS